MGMFKDMKDMMKTANSFERPSMRDAMKQGKEAMESASQMQQAMALGQTGVDGKAKILAIRDTGTLVNHDPMVEMDLEIESSTHGSYKQTVKQVVSKLAVGSYQPGADAPVKIDPNDQTKVLVMAPN